MSINKFGFRRKYDGDKINDDNVIKSTGGTMTGSLNMNQNKIVNLGDPIDKNDAVNRIFVYRSEQNIKSNIQKLISSFMKKDKLGNIDIQNKRIINIENPIDDKDCVTKQYVDLKTDKYVYSVTNLITPSNQRLKLSTNLVLQSTPLNNIFLLHGTVILHETLTGKQLLGNLDNMNINYPYITYCTVDDKNYIVTIFGNEINVDFDYNFILANKQIKVNTLVSVI